MSDTEISMLLVVLTDSLTMTVIGVGRMGSALAMAAGC
jgi:hypothetical protein